MKLKCSHTLKAIWNLKKDKYKGRGLDRNIRIEIDRGKIIRINLNIVIKMCRHENRHECEYRVRSIVSYVYCYI